MRSWLFNDFHLSVYFSPSFSSSPSSLIQFAWQNMCQINSDCYQLTYGNFVNLFWNQRCFANGNSAKTVSKGKPKCFFCLFYLVPFHAMPCQLPLHSVPITKFPQLFCTCKNFGISVDILLITYITFKFPQIFKQIHSNKSFKLQDVKLDLQNCWFSYISVSQSSFAYSTKSLICIWMIETTTPSPTALMFVFQFKFSPEWRK